jgi:CRP-like cAMP-binding protein
MLGHMDRGNLNLNQYLFKKGTKSDALYVVLRGTCDIYQGDKKIGIYNKGSIIGDSGLKNNVSRTFTVRCSSAQCDLLRLTKANYDKLIAEYKHRKESRNFKTLYNAHFFQGIPPEIIRRIEGICDEKTFHEGIFVISLLKLNV